MPILKNAEVWFVKANPKRPNAKFNKKNPTWECQVRTTDKAVKKAWEDLSLGVKAVIPDEEGAQPFYRVNLRKKSFKANGEPSSHVEVVNGKMQPVDPDTIGNGSIANVRIYQYEYTNEAGKKGLASVLMGIQLVKHIKYIAKAREDDFDETETETIEPEEKDEPGEDTDDSDDKY